MEDEKNFKERLSVNDKQTKTKEEKEEDYRKKLMDQYEFLTSDSSLEFTQKVFMTLGREIEESFPGVKFRLKGRVKSRESAEEKINRIINKSDKNDKKIFDTLGFCLVIDEIPFSAKIKHNLCQKSLNKRAVVKTQIAEQNLKLMRQLERYEKSEKDEMSLIKEKEQALEDIKQLIDEEKYNELLQLIDKDKKMFSDHEKQHIVHIGDIQYAITKLKEQYELRDRECNNYLARHILNKIIDESPSLSKLGISRIPHRAKVHDGGKTGYYVAFHDSVQSSKNKNWVLEIQAMSHQNYEESREGDAQHSKSEGKERVLPPYGDTKSEIEEFKELTLKETPQNMIYESGGKNEDGTIKKGRVYVCSEVENITYHFLEALEEHPELFKEIIRDEDLFSDVGKYIDDDVEL